LVAVVLVVINQTEVKEQIAFLLFGQQLAAVLVNEAVEPTVVMVVLAVLTVVMLVLLVQVTKVDTLQQKETQVQTVTTVVLHIWVAAVVVLVGLVCIGQLVEQEQHQALRVVL
jgi:Na+/H+ antiporter NhaA